jgi:formylglycine-generating enzyme required for sulfatase activity
MTSHNGSIAAKSAINGVTLKSGQNKNSKLHPPELLTIPEGDYILGISDAQVTQLVRTEMWAEEWFDKDLFLVEHPQHTVHVAGFQIGRKPVTNLEYYQFIWDSTYKVPKEWLGFRYAEGSDQHPVVGVSLIDCIAYCKWLSQKFGQEYRLLTEAEWECAARGGDERLYPWGDEFDPWRCNTLESGKRGTTEVGEYSPGGDSPFGVVDMAGNVWEWTISVLKPYPYNPKDGRESPDGRIGGRFVIRGGSWYYSHKLARTTVREAVLPTFASSALGFRLGKSIK